MKILSKIHSIKKFNFENMLNLYNYILIPNFGTYRTYKWVF